MRIPKAVAYVLCAIFALTLIAAAQTSGEHQMGSQGQKQPLSPRGQSEFTFADGKKVTVDYGRPYIRNRKIMGGLVPYGKVWRTGANAATSFVTDTNLKIGDVNVPAGKYTLYTLPGETGWQLIINKQTGQWGTQYDASQDLGRVPMKVTKLSSPVDQFTITFDKQGADSAIMKLEWENTSASVQLTQAK